jgi:hypothetical protein
MKPKYKEEVSLPEVVGKELEELDAAFHMIVRAYTQRFTTELDLVRRGVETIKEQKKIARGQIQDLRDMLMLIRQLEIKPTKGKRRDLKRLEGLVDDLQGFVRDWEATSRKQKHPQLD